jgi:pimeloyl-ACP methyl ester carboxylesterase
LKEWEPRMLAAARQIPTLVLWGEHDPYIPAWVAGRFGTDRIRRYQDSGHWLPAELPDEVAAALRDFLGPDP